MSIKELAVMHLLTTTDTYADIAKKIRATVKNAKTTDKCIAYYAHQLRKADKTCLSHRKSSKSSSASMKDLIAKYKTK